MVQCVASRKLRQCVAVRGSVLQCVALYSSDCTPLTCMYAVVQCVAASNSRRYIVDPETLIKVTIKNLATTSVCFTPTYVDVDNIEDAEPIDPVEILRGQVRRV